MVSCPFYGVTPVRSEVVTRRGQIRLTAPAVPGIILYGLRAVPGREVKGYSGPPATLGSTAEAQVRLIVWCNACRHRTEPDVSAMAAKYGAATPVRDWVGRLMCSQCSARDISFVLTGAKC